MVPAACCSAIDPAQPTLFPHRDGARWTRRDGWHPGAGVLLPPLDRLAVLGAVLDRSRVLLVNRPVPLVEARDIALEALRVGLAGNVDTVEDTVTCARAFFRYAAHHGLECLDEVDSGLVVSFINRAAHRSGVYRDPAPATVRNRRWEIRELFDTLRRLQLWDGPVEFGDPVPSRTGDATRPLTAIEMHRVRVHSYEWLVPTRRPLVVALAEAGGSAAEIAGIERGDIDLTAGTVVFRGGPARTNRIPTEALDALRAALAAGATVGTCRLVVGDTLDANRAKRSVTQELSDAIRDAGLSRTPLVSGRSIRLHQALNLFRTDGIGTAVRFLGSQSVDTTMRSLGLTVDDL